jgi:hypothetical protein
LLALSVLVAGAALAAAATIWRVTGGTFEDLEKSDLVGRAMLGLTCTLGCVLCLTRREG